MVDRIPMDAPSEWVQDLLKTWIDQIEDDETLIMITMMITHRRRVVSAEKAQRLMADYWVDFGSLERGTQLFLNQPLNVDGRPVGIGRGRARTVLTFQSYNAQHASIMVTLPWTSVATNMHEMQIDEIILHGVSLEKHRHLKPADDGLPF